MAPQTEEDKSSGLVLTILTCCLGLICGKPEDETPHTPAQATEQTTADTHTITSAPEPQINTQTHAHEQVSSENVVPTADELGDLSAACNRLWGLDINRLLPGSEYKINVQGGKKAYDMTYDAAPEPLFSFVDKKGFFNRPTYSAFYQLLDNYEKATGQKETMSHEERSEVNRFLSVICDTPCMQYVHQYLVSKGKAERSLESFKKLLWQTWFSGYRRDTQNDTSGFEHVFVGEVRNGEVMGLHNWIQFFVEEKAGKIDYKGYIYPRRRGNNPDEEDRVLTVQFAWEGITKQVTTLLIGTSPEFELALYTLCFLAGQDDNQVTVGDYDLIIKTHRIRSKYGDKVGSSYVTTK